MAGDTIAPASPPVPRLSVLPLPIPVKPGELTTPPLATVRVPTRQSQGSPIASEVSAFKTEPAPVTVTVEVKVAPSPTLMAPFTLTTPPLEIVSVPGPPLLLGPFPTKRTLPTFHAAPGPVTVTAGVPPGRKASISAPLWL